MQDLKMTILVIIFMISFLFAIGLNLLFQERKSHEGGIAQAITSANYCETASDCTRAGSVCPFGCDIFVNTAEAERISSMLSSYQSTCQYSCVQLKRVECVENRCVSRYE